MYSRNYYILIPLNKLFDIRKYGTVVQHWIIMQKIASSSLFGAVFAMDRDYFSYQGIEHHRKNSICPSLW
jgi:hypothetical protein